MVRKYGTTVRKTSYRGYKNYRFKKAIQNVVQKQISHAVEDKHLEINLTSDFSSVSSSWIERALCSISQGVTGVTRIGRSIKIKSLKIEGVVACGANESVVDDAYNALRVVVLKTVGAQAGNTPLATSGATINTEIRNDNTARGIIKGVYLDKYIALNTTGTEKGNGDGYAAGVKVFKFYKNFPGGIKIQFSDDTTNYPTTQLFVSMISNSTATVNPGFICGRIFMRYEDA